MSKPKLRNYTSTVPVTESIGRIYQLLAGIGATQIMQEYVGGQPSSLLFVVETPEVGKVAYRLPVQTEGVKKMMRMNDAQAERTTWKTLAEWVQIQCDMVRLEQMPAGQAFMAYVLVDKTTTLYDQIKKNQFKLLKGKGE